MLRAHDPSQLPGIAELILVGGVLAPITNGECLHGSAFAFGEEGGIRARVDPARQEYADGHVGELAQPHGGAQLCEELARDLFLGLVCQWTGVIPHIPVPLFPHRAVSSNTQPRSASELADPSEQRAGWRRRHEREVVIERDLIDLADLIGIGEKRLDLRCEGYAAVVSAVIQGLDANPVAGEPELAVPTVPQCDGEHPTEPLKACDPPLLVCVDDHFGVGVIGSPEMASRRLEVSPDLGVVVYLTVEDHPDRAVFIRHRLISLLREIDDLQPPERETDSSVG